MDNKIVNLKQKFKTVFSTLAAIVLAFCFCFAAIGCERAETEHPFNYSLRIAKEQFSCQKVLWYCHCSYRNDAVAIVHYNTQGFRYSYPLASESLFEMKYGGALVLGVDKNGWEKFIAVPDQRSKSKKPQEIQWPFIYSFTEILDFASEHGYKYVDGIDNFNEEQLDDYYDGAFQAIYRSLFISKFGTTFEDADKKFDALAAKLVLHYSIADEENSATSYFIMQECGDLKMYEEVRSGEETVMNVITYERKKHNIVEW